MDDRDKLNRLQTEYIALKQTDQDAERRHALRAEVNELSHLMGPAEAEAWFWATGASSRETADEGYNDIEIAFEKSLEDQALSKMVDGGDPNETDLAFLPGNWVELVSEIRQQRFAIVAALVSEDREPTVDELAQLPDDWPQLVDWHRDNLARPKDNGPHDVPHDVSCQYGPWECANCWDD